MRQTKEDQSKTIIKNIMKTSIPAQGELSNPFKKKKNELTLGEIISDRNKVFPDNIKQWTPKVFVEYFAQKYQEETNGNYRVMYRSDMTTFKEIFKFFTSTGLEKKEWTKKFVDWSFKRRSDIIKKEGHFTIQDINRYVNYFYQDVVLPKVEKDEVDRSYCEEDILKEIEEANKEGKAKEIFLRFGIPVAASYFVNVQGMKEPAIVAGIEKFLDTLSKGNSVERQRFTEMINKSIILSPYPEDFVLLDWRNRFETYVSRFHHENWWRDEDYKGKSLSQYDKLKSP